MSRYPVYFSIVLFLSGLIGCTSVDFKSQVVPTTFENTSISEEGYKDKEYVIQAGDVIEVKFFYQSLDKKRGYVLQPGDVIEIKFFYRPDINERLTIRPDGKISLLLLDEIKAAGLTPAELDKLLTQKYSKTLRNPEISVIVRKFFSQQKLNEKLTVRPDGRVSLLLVGEVKAAGLTPRVLDKILTEKYSESLLNPEIAVIVREFSAQKIYVGGEVRSPGMIPITGRLTALQAVFQSGGFKNTAEVESIVILRDQKLNKPSIKILNIKQNPDDNAGEKDPEKVPTQYNDVLLKPFDIVFVPKSGIAKADQFVDQYFEKLVPVSKNFGFSYFYDLKPRSN